jgi:hypothetical protein
VELVVALELDAVGCTSLMGAGPTEGCCANRLPDWASLLVVGAELEGVGATMISGNPLEGVLEDVVSSVVGLKSSLVVVEDVVSGAELGAVGSTIVSGKPCEGTSEEVDGKPSPNVFWLSPPKGFSSLPSSNGFSSSSDVLVVVAGALEVVDDAGRDEDVSVLVIVTV